MRLFCGSVRRASVRRASENVQKVPGFSFRGIDSIRFIRHNGRHDGSAIRGGLLLYEGLGGLSRPVLRCVHLALLSDALIVHS